jgi:DHA2 family multidrug resistance protein-like MFS transporter
VKKDQVERDEAAALLDGAREAFVQGMHVTAYAGAALLAYTGIQAMILLNRKKDSTLRM